MANNTLPRRFQDRSNTSQFLMTLRKAILIDIFPLNEFFKIQNKNLHNITKKMVYKMTGI